jgi:MSHA pilin protein MshC
LFELVAVLLILGVLAAIATMKYSSGNASAVSEAEIFKACLRYAQTRAMSDISTWGIEFDSGRGAYSLVTDNPSITATGVAPVLPGVGSSTRTLANGVKFSAASGGTTVPANIYFDYRGRPATTRGVEYLKTGTSLTLSSSRQTVYFTGDSTVTVTIEANTGFAQ